MSIFETIGSFLCIFGLCFGPILLIGFGLPALAYINKRRNARNQRRHDQQHRSKIPYRLIAYLLLGVTLLAVVGVIYLVVTGAVDLYNDLQGIAGIILVPLILAIAAFRSYILQNMPSASEALEEDPRPPALYLRSFNQEMLKFVDLSNEDKAKYNSFLNYAKDVHLPPFEHKLYDLMNQSALLAFDAPVNAEDVTFEKYFRAEVSSRIGPLVALGNPIDDLPAEGAFRDYQIDESWKDVFFKHADQSACILMQLGNSDNLQFELTSIIARGLRQKLFIITPPQTNVKDKTEWIRKYILREKPANWENFSAILKKNGYQLPEKAPGIGAVITFEPDGSPLILVQGAFQPAEYISPIAARLKELSTK